MPHAHILLTLRAEDKFTTSQKIDQFVCVEVPSSENLKLWEIVKKCIIHGPCGVHNPQTPCMNNDQCMKRFPKIINDDTIPIANGYPLYSQRPCELVEIVKNV